MSRLEDYETTSNNYDRQRFAMGAEVIASMIQFHCKKPQQQIHILDAGCGTGNYAKAILDYGYGHVTMIDASAGMLEKAKAKLAGEIACGRVAEIRQHTMPTLPFKDASFDAVMFNLVLHHIEENPDGQNFPRTQETLLEARRVLKTGGILCISTIFPSEFSPKQWYERLEEAIGARCYKRYPEARQWMAIFDKTGFKTISMLTAKVEYRRDDPEGPARKAWRDADSYWGAATPTEIASVENKIRTMKENGTLHQFVKTNDKTDGFCDLVFLFAS